MFSSSHKAQDIPVYKQGAHLGTRTTEPSVTASLEQNQLTVNVGCYMGIVKVYVYGAICGFEGQVSVFHYGEEKKDYRDLYPDEEEMKRMPPPPKGVMGITPAVTGSIEATEVLKIICGFGEVLSGKLWTIDLRTLQSNKFSL